MFMATREEVTSTFVVGIDHFTNPKHLVVGQFIDATLGRNADLRADRARPLGSNAIRYSAERSRRASAQECSTPAYGPRLVLIDKPNEKRPFAGGARNRPVVGTPEGDAL